MISFMGRRGPRVGSRGSGSQGGLNVPGKRGVLGRGGGHGKEGKVGSGVNHGREEGREGLWKGEGP